MAEEVGSGVAVRERKRETNGGRYQRTYVNMCVVRAHLCACVRATRTHTHACAHIYNMYIYTYAYNIYLRPFRFIRLRDAIRARVIYLVCFIPFYPLEVESRLESTV